MLSELEQFQEDLSYLLYGRSQLLAIAGSSCVRCGGPAVDFCNEVSREEFGNSALCQECQDRLFGFCESESISSEGHKPELEE